MIKAVTFVRDNPDDEMNDFFREHPDINILDVKYSSAYNDYYNCVIQSVLILYKE